LGKGRISGGHSGTGCFRCGKSRLHEQSAQFLNAQGKRGKSYLLNECIQNFLYGEPILRAADEVQYIQQNLERAQYAKISEIFNVTIII